MASIGHAVVGDPVYGGKLPGKTKAERERFAAAAKKLGRQALHAQVIAFVHPKTEERLEFSSELPRDISALIASLEMSQKSLYT
jgi:23S rRNA pseudouridine1911/1915/1917 synthase